MDGTLVAKQPIPPSPADDGNKVTTWKCYKRTAAILRKIAAHLNCKQEDTLEEFVREFDNYLARLQAKDVEERKKKPAD